MAREINPRSLSDDSLRPLAVDGRVIGYSLDLLNIRYRCTPLSCVEKLSLRVDGVPVDERDILVRHHDKRFMVSRLPDLWAEVWDMNAAIRIEVLKKDGLAPGVHDVDVELLLRIPYIFAHAKDTSNIRREDAATSSFATEDASCAKALRLQEGGR